METAVATVPNTNPEEPKSNFGFFLLALLVILLIGGCKGNQNLAVTERITHDTCYISNMQYDSIYVYQEHSSDLKPSSLSREERGGSDTIVIRDKSVEFRYKMLRDTVKVIQRDSIPYEVRVIETKVERYTPWYARTLAFIGFLALVWFLGRTAIRIYSAIHR